jgi:hypothetical protein
MEKAQHLLSRWHHRNVWKINLALKGLLTFN